MAKSSSDRIDIDLLRRLVAYDPGTGFLTWKFRHIGDHTNNSPNDLKRWNIRHEGKRAFNDAASPDGYMRGRIHGFRMLAHVAAWAIYYGKWPDQEVDHINRNRSANWIDNLRDVSPFVNSNNKGTLGVSFHKRDKKWIAKAIIDGVTYRFGRFDNAEDAINAKRLGLIKIQMESKND